MKRYLLDTGIMGDFINHRRGVDAHVQEGSRSGVPRRDLPTRRGRAICRN